MIPTLLALSMAPAPVYVQAANAEVDRETRSLHDQLILRLLEEGYPLVPSADQATRTLRVEPSDDGLRVVAEGEDTRSFEIATGPVLPLEAVHRAMEALDEVTPREQTVAVPSRRFAVHVSDAPAGVSAELLRQILVRELLAHDGAVVRLDDSPDAVLCAESLGDDLALSRGDSVEQCGLQPTVVDLEESRPEPQSLEQSLEQLMAEPEQLDVKPLQEPRVVTPKATTAPRLAVDRDPEADRRGPAVRIGARTGVYGRITDADAAVGTTLRVGREPGPGGLFDVLMLPTSAPDISIFETSITAGFGWMWTLHPVVSLEIQGLGGVQIHRYRQRGHALGHRATWTVELPVVVSFRLARGLRLDLAFRAGRTGSDREHRVEDVVVWARSPWSVGGTVGLSYGWRPR